MPKTRLPRSITGTTGRSSHSRGLSRKKDDLSGLQLIQPELKCASQALATVEASIDRLSKSIPVPVALSDQLNKIEGRFPYDDAPLTAEQKAVLKAKLKAEFPAPLIRFACHSMGIHWGAL